MKRRWPVATQLCNFNVGYHDTLFFEGKAMGDIQYSADTFSRITKVLEARASEMGAQAFALNDEIILPSTALDEAGPLTWALAIHADALARLIGISTPHANMLPYTMVESPDSPFGNLCVIQKGGITLSLAINFIDAALEHCVCMAMHSYGLTPSEWDQLPVNEQVVPIEPYFEDLKASWVSDEMESNDRAILAINYPTLYTRPLLENRMLLERQVQTEPGEKPAVSRPISFASMR